MDPNVKFRWTDGSSFAVEFESRLNKSEFCTAASQAIAQYRKQGLNRFHDGSKHQWVVSSRQAQLHVLMSDSWVSCPECTTPDTFTVPSRRHESEVKISYNYYPSWEMEDSLFIVKEVDWMLPKILESIDHSQKIDALVKGSIAALQDSTEVVNDA